MILTYDVKVKRVGKVRKAVKQYLRPVQRSVFEGFLSEGKLKKLKNAVLNVIDTEEDAVRIYTFQSLREAAVEEIGKIAEADSVVL